jgi:carboxymethylenebutenolidase
MPSQNIEIPFEDSAIAAYFAAPASGASGGVIVVNTIFGVDDELKGVVDDLVDAGFAAAAPDMFWQIDPGPVPVSKKGMQRAQARNGSYNSEDGLRYVAAAVADMKARPECNGKVAVMGFCFGGPYALMGASRLGCDAGISFHGSHVAKFMAEFGAVQCPLSFHYGDNDAVAPMTEITGIKAAIDALDGSELFIYPGAEHGYMFPSRGDGYDVAARDVSWERALAVLNRM